MGGGSGGCFEGDVELPIMLAALVEWRRGALAFLKDGLEVRGECVWQGDAEGFAWVGVFALGVYDGDHLSLKIDGLGAKLGLGEAASEMRANLEGREHPRGALAGGERGPGGDEVLGSELFFYLGSLTWDLGQGEGVFLAQLPAHGLLHDAGEKLKLEAGGIF